MHSAQRAKRRLRSAAKVEANDEPRQTEPKMQQRNPVAFGSRRTTTTNNNRRSQSLDRKSQKLKKVKEIKPPGFKGKTEI